MAKKMSSTVPALRGNATMPVGGRGGTKSSNYNHTGYDDNSSDEDN